MKQWLFRFLVFSYVVIYLLLAFGAAGAGHGTNIFLAAAIPYGIGLLILVGYRYFKGEWILVPSPLEAKHLGQFAGHYVAVALFVLSWWAGDFYYEKRVWEIAPENILLPLGWYLAGQVIIWAVLIRRISANT